VSPFALRRFLVAAAWAGLASVQVLLALSYLSYGTWWHYLLHQYVGWGAGLAVAALVAVHTRRRLPVVVALVGGQVLSIVPDLMFRFARMPHTASMDLWLGHISIHTGPSPLVVTTGALLLGGASWFAAQRSARGPATVLAAATGALVLVACLLAEPVPTTLAEFPL
jgi:hypothetical protein